MPASQPQMQMQTCTKTFDDALAMKTRPHEEQQAVKELLETNIAHLGRVIWEINNKTKDRDIGVEGFKMIEVQQILHAYVEAIRDLDTIHQSLSSTAMSGNGPHSSLQTVRTPAGWQTRLDRDIETLRAPEISRHKIKRILRSTASYKRYGIALTAGAAVLAPMMIMVLAIPSQRNLDQWQNVVVVSISVLFLATFVSWTSDSSHQELVVAVASYAAVLLIFVGTQTQSQPDRLA